MLPKLVKFILFCAIVESGFGQTPVKLTLREAEAIALKNHPQILASEHDVSYANQQIVETRSAYYPSVTGVVTGSQANDLARIGAGDLPASRLFTREGQGIVASQLITDSGRTPNLVASSRLNARASEQDLNATRYDVLLAVNRAYYELLRSQATVKVALETVAARQTLSDQITELGKKPVEVAA
jgi:outer membrane protein